MTNDKAASTLLADDSDQADEVSTPATGDTPDKPVGGDVVDAAPGRDVAQYDLAAGAVVVPTSIAGLRLTFTRDQKTLTADQMHLLSPLGIEANWDPAQVAVFLLQCQASGLDPWAKEAYLLKIDGKFVHHIGIGGFRTRAQRTGRYRGRIGPQWCGPDGVWRDVWLDSTTPPSAARVGILRDDADAPFWGTAIYDEYAPMVDEQIWEGEYGTESRRKRRTGRKVPAANWKAAQAGGKPTVMLAKCAEAAGFRAGFPTTFNGFYEPAEFEKARVEAEDTAGRTRPAKDDPAAQRRREAYEAATKEAAEAPPPAMFAGLGLPDVAARALLIAELDEQGVILGKTRSEMTARWEAARGGQPFADWPLAAVTKLVHTIRPMVVEKLRLMNRGPEAGQYAAAPPVGTCEQLFGRGAASINQVDDAAAEAAA